MNTAVTGWLVVLVMVMVMWHLLWCVVNGPVLGECLSVEGCGELFPCSEVMRELVMCWCGVGIG